MYVRVPAATDACGSFIPLIPGMFDEPTLTPSGVSRSVGYPSLAGVVTPPCRCATIGTGSWFVVLTSVVRPERALIVGPGNVPPNPQISV